MGLKILYGRAGSGKSYNIYHKIKNLVEKNEKVFLCVPEQFTHMTERKIMEIIGSISPFSCQVISFERIVQRVYEETGESTSGVLSDTVRSVIMSKAINSGELSLYSKMASNNGFVTLMEDMVTRFKKYSVTPMDIDTLGHSVTNQMTKEKLSDISKIYKEYQNLISEKYIDSADLITDVRDKIVSSGFFDSSYVFFDEFSSFIPPELDVIFEICKSAREVTVSLCTDTLKYTNDTRYSFFAPSIITSDKLTEGALKHGIPLVKNEFLAENMRHCKDSSLSGIERSIYSSFKKVPYKENNISINSYFDVYSEVKHTASKIISLCRDENMRFRDIAVICSDLQSYSGIIDDVFKKFGIRAFIDEKTPLIDLQPAQFVLGALKIYIESYSYESIFSYLRLGFLDIADEETDILEEYVLSVNINKSDWINDDRWNVKLDRFAKRTDLSDKYIAKINSVRKKFLDSVSSFHTDIRGRHSAVAMCDALYDYMIECGFEKKIKDIISQYEKASMIDEAKTVTLVWNRIVAILDEISEGLSDTLINPKELYTYLSVAFTSNKIGLLPTSSDCVTVGNADRTRIKNVKVLFVIGATENSFPKKQSQYGLFTSREKDVLAENNVEFIRTSLDEIYYQRFLVYSVITIPKERLFISYPCTDASGDTAREAMVVSMIKRNLGLETKYIPDDDEDFVTNTPFIGWENALTGIKHNPEKWKDIYTALAQIYPDKAKILKKSLFATNLPVNITDDLLKRYFSDTLYTSVSRLEKFASCKYSYFMNFMLNLSPRQSAGVDFANIGTLAHSVFEFLCKEIEREFGSYTQVTEKYIKEKITFYINEQTLAMGIDTERLSRRELFKIQRLNETLTTSFIQVVKQITDSRFSPLGYEITFNDQGLGCVELELSNGKKAKLTGVIDRADSYKTDQGEFVRVIDYKTGDKKFSFENLFYGLDFQLFVYLDVLTKSDKTYRPAGALYFKINDFIHDGDDIRDAEKVEGMLNKNYALQGIISSEEQLSDAFDETTYKNNIKKTATEDQFYLLFNHLEKKAAKLAEGIMSGVYSMDPYEKGNKTSCNRCNFSSVCRFSGRFRNIETMKAETVWERLEDENEVDN